MAANTGWTWAVVEDLTLSRLRALYRTWRDYPPFRITSALAAGIKPPSPSSGGQALSAEDEAELDRLIEDMERDAAHG